MDDIQTSQEDPYSSIYKTVSDHLQQAVDETRIWTAQELLLELEKVLDDMKNLVTAPSKSDASRQKIKSGQAELEDEVTYKFNEDFIQETIQLSDDLFLDELKAAMLIRKGKEVGPRVDRSPSRAALLLYHTRQQHLLSLILSILTYVDDERVEESKRRVLQDIANRIAGGKVEGAAAQGNGETYFKTCLKSMRFLREFYGSLVQKEQHAITLGTNLREGWSETAEDLLLQRRSITHRHETLALILCELIQQRRVTVGDFKALIASFSEFGNYNLLVAHHLAPTYAFISSVCSPETPFMDFRDVVNLHRELKTARRDSPWPLKPVHAVVWIWWLSNLNGLCSENAEAVQATGMDYIEDMADPMKTALAEGGLEFLLSLTAGLCRGLELDANRDDIKNFLIGKNKLTAEYDLLSQEYWDKIIANLELFIDNFITNMADILKELKIREEEEDALFQKSDEVLDLERLFFIITFLFYGRKDAASSFWTDADNNLHGFLLWASQRQTALMTTIFCYMLSSLAFGEECATACHQFLLSDAVPGTARSRRKDYLSWDKIITEMREFGSILDGTKKQPLAIQYKGIHPLQPLQVMQTQDQTQEPSLENALMIDSYIRLVSRLARESSSARDWLLNYEETRMVDWLFQLLDSRIPVQLLPSTFQAIASFLVDKNLEINAVAWNNLDEWAFAAPKVPATPIGINPANPQIRASKNLDTIVGAIHPANAFIQLLVALVQPSTDASPLNDELPFPESLGSSNRISGMDPFVDFVMNDIFVGTLWDVFGAPKEIRSNIYSLTQSTFGQSMLQGDKKTAKPDMQDENVMLRTTIQLSCLKFVRACLQTFNEELIMYAGTTNVAMDVAIQSTSLATYAKLHPFARIMEHILSEKVIRVLLEIMDFGALVLPECLESSPFVELVHETMEVLDLALQLQATYINIIRKTIKEQDGDRRPGFDKTIFDRVEDAVLLNLQLIVDLGLFVGMNFGSITASSLKLLQRLITSPRLINAPEVTIGRQTRINRVINAVQTDEHSQQVIFAFIDLMNYDGPDGTAVKLEVLQLLQESLDASGNKPSLAHFLLGFEVTSNGVELSINDGGIGSGVSLLHIILQLVNGDPTRQSPDEYYKDDLELREACFNVLRRLWKTLATSEDTRYVLRANNFFFAQYVQELPITTETRWMLTNEEGYSYNNPEFFTTPAAQCACSFLRRRSCLLDYAAEEIRVLSQEGAATMVAKYLSSLLGMTVDSEGNRIPNVNIFELLDFMELDLPHPLMQPPAEYFSDTNISACTVGNGYYDLNKVKSVLLLKKAELLKQGLTQVSDAELNVMIEGIINFLFVQNQHKAFALARLQLLQSWTQLVSVVLESCDFTPTSRMSFILQAFQTVLPKIEMFSTSDTDAVQFLSSLAHRLISHVVFDQKTFGKGKAGDIASEKLYQLFRIALRCVQTPQSTASLREDFYNIAYLYLKGMGDITADGKVARRHSTQSIKASGDRLLEVICNDAYAGEGSCRIIALLLLESITHLAASEKSDFVIDALYRQNFFVVLIDTIKHIGEEVEASEAGMLSPEVVMLTFKAKTSFLLRVAETRTGAGYLLTSGLLHAVRESRIFSVDPDIGFGVGGPRALKKYYELLLSIMRVVTSCILVRGPQNKQAIEAGRRFLTETRPVAASIFKKHLNIGGGKDTPGIEELTNLFVLLMDATEFIEMENGFV